MNQQQPDLFTAPAATSNSGVPEGDLLTLRYALKLAGTWQTRAQLCQRLNWTERQVRAAGEALGTEVVRGQLGYKLTRMLTRDDVPAALQACDAFESQAHKNAAYAQALRRIIHSIVG